VTSENQFFSMRWPHEASRVQPIQRVKKLKVSGPGHCTS
jgi:hypothetical protein